MNTIESAETFIASAAGGAVVDVPARAEAVGASLRIPDGLPSVDVRRRQAVEHAIVLVKSEQLPLADSRNQGCSSWPTRRRNPPSGSMDSETATYLAADLR